MSGRAPRVGILCAALALGLAMGSLLTAGGLARPAAPHDAYRWLAYPLVLAPLALLAGIGRTAWARSLFADWNVTTLLVLSGFFRAGAVLLIPMAGSPWQLAAISILTGVGAGAAALLWRWIESGRRTWLMIGELLLAAGGVYLGAIVFGAPRGEVSYYGSSGLFVLSAVLVSFAGRVDV